MSKELPITSYPAPESRYLYTYFGRTIETNPYFEPIYVPDSRRSRPMLVLGAAGFGKTEALLNLAFTDACKGRCTIVIDGKNETGFRNKLYYYNHVIAKRPFLSFMPVASADEFSHTYNPFSSTTQNIKAVAEAFFNAYRPPHPTNKADASDYYIDRARDSFTDLLRALHFSGYAYCIRDLRFLLENHRLLEMIQPFIVDEGVKHYGDLMDRIKEIGQKRFQETISGFVTYLRKFDHWTMNSYNPDIIFDRLIYTDSTIYIGLPVDSEPNMMRAIGNIIINQLMGLSSYMQTNEKKRRPIVSVFIDEGQALIDTNMANWVARVRSSGMMLTLSTQTLDDLAAVSPTLANQISTNTSNCMMFNPHNVRTAEWFAKLVGHEARKAYSLGGTAEADEMKEGESGTIRLEEKLRVPVDMITSLRTGQCFYSPPDAVKKPFWIAAPYLPDPPDRPDCKHRKIFYPTRIESRGLAMSQAVNKFRMEMASIGGAKRPF
jgi:hypothetical protein